VFSVPTIYEAQCNQCLLPVLGNEGGICSQICIRTILEVEMANANVEQLCHAEMDVVVFC